MSKKVKAKAGKAMHEHVKSGGKKTRKERVAEAGLRVHASIERVLTFLYGTEEEKRALSFYLFKEAEIQMLEVHGFKRVTYEPDKKDEFWFAPEKYRKAHHRPKGYQYQRSHAVNALKNLFGNKELYRLVYGKRKK